jgi:hypothetical protein
VAKTATLHDLIAGARIVPSFDPLSELSGHTRLCPATQPGGLPEAESVSSQPSTYELADHRRSARDSWCAAQTVPSDYLPGLMDQTVSTAAKYSNDRAV